MLAFSIIALIAVEDELSPSDYLSVSASVKASVGISVGCQSGMSGFISAHLTAHVGASLECLLRQLSRHPLVYVRGSVGVSVAYV